MRKVFVASHNIFSSLGNTSGTNFERIRNGHSGIIKHHLPMIDLDPIWVSMLGTDHFSDEIYGLKTFTKFEKMMVASVKEAAKGSKIDLSDEKTIFIIATTKGNVSLLEEHPFSNELLQRINLFHSAKLVSDYFGNNNKPLVVSNACISGINAIVLAKRLLKNSAYDHAVVIGADTLSKFVYSGFKSFQALSPERCKPFSAARDGINLGEAAATMILTINEQTENNIEITGGAGSNDANHISGPSRTGEELAIAIQKTLIETGIDASAIDFVSAHGTGTLYNDEMEAKALTITKLNNTPVNSLKGYFGHTLGAAGVLESIISVLSLKHGQIIPSFGFVGPPLEPEINICKKIENRSLSYCLKTASGFGGCNGAVVFYKHA